MNEFFSVSQGGKCNICGGDDFRPGPGGRLALGAPPHCIKCGSMERHRIIRNVYRALTKEFFDTQNAIQFSSDPSVPQNWFKEFTLSEYGGVNSQDLRNIGYADGSFDWVVCNHV